MAVLVVAGHGACEAGVVRGFGHGEVGAYTFSAPCKELVVAGCDAVDIHQVTVGFEGVAALAALPYYIAAFGVDDVEGYCVDLVGEGVGKV